MSCVILHIYPVCKNVTQRLYKLTCFCGNSFTSHFSSFHPYFLVSLEGQQMQNAVSAKISQNLNTVISSGNREDLEQVNARQTPTKTIFSSHANKLL